MLNADIYSVKNKRCERVPTDSENKVLFKKNILLKLRAFISAIALK